MVLQGVTPVTLTYQLSITSPTTVTAATPVSVAFTVLSTPSGVTSQQAQGFISASPSTLNFTAASQTQTVTVSVIVATTYAGDYGFQINTTGWPSGSSDPGATVNVNASAPSTTPVAPQITLSPSDGTVYTAAAGASSVTIPITYTAAVETGTGLTSPPITATSVSVNGTSVSSTITSGALGTLDVGGSSSFVATASGTYTISASATNSVGTSAVTSDVTVVFTGQGPTITATNPTTLTYNYTLGGAAISVPVGFRVVSPAGAGDVTTVSASLAGPGGTSATVYLPTQNGVGSAATATVAGTAGVNQPGTYTLTYIGSNNFGSASTTVSFTVTGVYPVPTIAIGSPAANATFQIPAGGSSVAVPYTLTGGTTYGTITAVTASLKGPSATTAETPAISNLNTAAITGSGTLTITAPGTYTLNATDTNSGGMTATTSTTFTVTQAAPPEVVVWLPPVSLGQAICGGSVLPVSFKISNNGAYVSDTSIVVAIYQVYSNGTSSTPVIYTYNSSCSWSSCNGGQGWGWGGCGNGSCSNNNYGCGNWNSAGWNACTTYYTIGSKNLTYSLYFPTDTGANTYRIEVYKQTGSSASSIQILGTATVTTASCGTCYDNNGNQCSAKDDSYGNCILQGKCWGNYKSGSCSWGGNGSCENSYGCGYTNNSSYTGSTYNKSCDNNSCVSNGWGNSNNSGYGNSGYGNGSYGNGGYGW